MNQGSFPQDALHLPRKETFSRVYNSKYVLYGITCMELKYILTKVTFSSVPTLSYVTMN